ncbi:secretion protein [Erwinia psidii]|uniref:type II secretion system pilot lipoprotein GspS n=1 Tax=Erwinia psidii TaxID=69224 RepID=UPI00226B40B5|nr:type II secretion system pilot lipoprotein GspS [Erwinia psidii]MCX8962489.1 secretion protein [Erwinia psidii]
MKENIISVTGIIVVTLCVFLAGCQQKSASAPASSIQIDQLSSLVAGSKFLREQCSNNTIPGDAVLLSRAISLAEKKGWNTYAAEYQEINPKINDKMTMITRDSTSLPQKCQQLQLSLANFIAETQHRS